MAECGVVDVTCKATTAVDAVTGGWATDMKEAIEGLVRGVFTGWLNIPVPMVGDAIGPVGFLQEHLLVIAGLFLAVSTVCFGIRLIFKASREVIGSGAAFYARVMVVIGGAATITRILVTSADGYSLWIIDAATEGTGLADTLLSVMGLTGMVGFWSLLLYGTVAFAFALVQGVLLAARSFMIPLLVGCSPVVVALSQTTTGEAWWNKYLSYFTAFLLYKPTAATIYATGFYLLGEGNILESQSMGEAIVRGMNFIYGAVMMLMAVGSFFALTSVITPVVGKLSGGVSGLAIVGASAASLAATGVINRGMTTNNTQVGGPTSVTPVNHAAGGPGAQGPTGAHAPVPSPAPAPSQSMGHVHPVVAGTQVAGTTIQATRNAVNNGINPQEGQQ